MTNKGVIGAPCTGANPIVLKHTFLDYQSEFIRAMGKNGIVPNLELCFDDFGKIIRFGVIGDKVGSKNGWAVLFPNGRGVFGSWKLNLSVNWSADCCKFITKTERKLQIIEHNKFKLSYEKQKIEQQKQAASKCHSIWHTAVSATSISHQYIINKKILPCGIRQTEKDLLIPIQDMSGHIVNLQYINSSGYKKFHFGAAVSGNFMVIGELKGTVYLVEGFATGATIHEVSGNNIVVAFNVGNLEAVVINLRKVGIEVIIAADNDRFSQKNIGLSVASNISKKYSIKLVYPEFEPWMIGSDFNDLISYYSSEVILKQLQGAYYE